MRIALDLYPCDLLFVHRDSEGESYQARVDEIRNAVGTAKGRGVVPPAICVVPIRMMEAWFLFDEGALRRAAGNPHGRMVLELPRIGKIEAIPDPKSLLHGLLRDASGLRGQRRKKLPVDACVHRIAELCRSFAPLRELTAFHSLERELANVLSQQGWR
ncbi:MAG: hypothetical protein AB1714_27220 [Acidobacteriota bacterium]